MSYTEADRPPSVLDIDNSYHVVDNTQQMADLDIICSKCTQFDAKGHITVKKMLKYDARNARFRCEQCSRTYGEKQIRQVLNLNMEEYVHYEKETPIKETLRRRDVEENYILRPNNPLPLGPNTIRAIVFNKKKREKEKVDKANIELADYERDISIHGVRN